MVTLIALFALSIGQNSLSTGYQLYSRLTPQPKCCDSMAQFVKDPRFLAAHFTPRQDDAKKLEGHKVTFSTPMGGNASAYLVPGSAKNHIAILMFHEFWGLNKNIETTADKLHDLTGYEVVLPDLYDGKVTSNPKLAGQYMASNNEQRSASIITGTFQALESGKFGPKPFNIGTVGYCFGGGWSERAAIIGSNLVQACVVYYGMPDIRPQSLARLKAPVLMFQGLKDQWITQKVVNGFKSAMIGAHKNLKVYPYNAVHAFANPSNPNFDAPAAKDALKKELAFFKLHLKQ